MVADAERYAESDRKLKETSDARNQYENTVYSTRQMYLDQPETPVRTAVTEFSDLELQWLETVVDCTAEEFVSRLAEYTGRVSTLVSEHTDTKQPESAQTSAPTVEEVD
jgi:molecular chaperone DnaK (HSP70)